MQKLIKIVAISGCATCGKDTLYSILEKILEEHNIETQRFALADILKVEINDFTTKQYGISAFTKDKKEKELIRPIMVEHGRIKRFITNGKYWTSLLTNPINEAINNNILPIVTDCRFASATEDEHYWVKNILGGKIVHITRILMDGSPLLPPNKDEEENDPKMKEVSDYFLHWPTTDNLELRMDCVKIQLKELIERIIDERN